VNYPPFALAILRHARYEQLTGKDFSLLGSVVLRRNLAPMKIAKDKPLVIPRGDGGSFSG
jgi:hypothetical protein